MVLLRKMLYNYILHEVDLMSDGFTLVCVRIILGSFADSYGSFADDIIHLQCLICMLASLQCLYTIHWALLQIYLILLQMTLWGGYD